MTDRNREDGTFERVGESMGEAAGKVAGRMADTAFSATGAMFNSMASMLGSWWSSAGANRAADSFSSREQACRAHHQARSSSGAAARRDYEGSRPLYQFGHVAGQSPAYQGRSFSEVEPELRRAWETGGTNEYGSWEEVRDYVGYGFGQGTGSPGLDRDATTGGASGRDRAADDSSGGGI